MGLLTLADFRSRLDRMLGRAGYDNSELDDWVNDGYLDITGAVDFRVLRKSVDITQTADDDTIDLATEAPDFFAVRIFLNLTDDLTMLRKSDDEFNRLDPDADSGDPQFWGWLADTLKIHPPPDESKTLRLVYQAEPSLLSAGGDTTVLPNTYDKAVLLLAAHHAMLELGESARAQEMLTRAFSYIRSRKKELDYEADSREERGLDIARSRSDLSTFSG